MVKKKYMIVHHQSRRRDVEKFREEAAYLARRSGEVIYLLQPKSDFPKCYKWVILQKC